jgi:hypothetical protein
MTRRKYRNRKPKEAKVEEPMPDFIEVEVDNPRYEPGHPNEIRKVKVQRALRNDVIERLRQQKRLSDVECMVAREMQRLYEDAEVGGIGAMDPTREPVDGRGAAREPITDRQQRAMKRLAELQGNRWGIGRDGMAVVRQVCAEGMMPEQIARSWGYTSQRQVAFVGQYLRRMLRLLAVPLGYTSRAA